MTLQVMAASIATSHPSVDLQMDWKYDTLIDFWS